MRLFEGPTQSLREGGREAIFVLLSEFNLELRPLRSVGHLRCDIHHNAAERQVVLHEHIPCKVHVHLVINVLLVTLFDALLATLLLQVKLVLFLPLILSEFRRAGSQHELRSLQVDFMLVQLDELPQRILVRNDRVGEHLSLSLNHRFWMRGGEGG